MEEELLTKREQNTYLDITHSPIDVPKNNYWSAQENDAEFVAFDPATATTTEKIKFFLEKKVGLWISHALKHFFKRKHPFITYSSGNGGIYIAKDKNGNPTENVKIAITGDWATNTPESTEVANRMMDHEPEYTIHLGDTYYTGEKVEIEQNYLAPKAPWKKGLSGSFALMGNHEMYTAGESYYNCLLPQLGERDFSASSLRYLGQTASYFCIKTNSWIVIGLDTGYNSEGFPFLVNPGGSLRADCRFDEGLIKWLKDDVKLGEEKHRGIIFLSHHQYCSAYEKEFYKPAEQIADIIGKNRPVLWLWGHEHRFSVYGKFTSKNGIPAYGRCIGHGGMPVEIRTIFEKESKLKFDNLKETRKLVITDKRVSRNVDNPKVPVGYNGYALLNLNDNTATISYFSIGRGITNEKDELVFEPSIPLLTEIWSVNNGTIKGEQAEQLTNTPDFSIEKGKVIQDMHL